jgi:hypothetical protein
LLRGLAVIAMIIDHIAGDSPLRWLTGGNHFYTSAAEGFVLLAGFTAGLVSARAVQRGSLSTTARRFLLRAVLLYLLVCAITLVFNIDQLLVQLPDILTLKQHHAFLDVLVLYAMLFVLAPLEAYLLASGRTWVLVSASVGMWVAYQLTPQTFMLPFGLGRAGDFTFPLEAWQLLFCAAMAAGYHRARIARGLTRLRRMRLLLAAGLSSAGLCIAYNLVGVDTGVGGLFSKEAVSIGRLVASASIFPLLFALMSVLGARTQAVVGRLLMPFGRHSLLAFVLHLIALVAITVATNATGRMDGPLANAGLQLLTVGFVWASIRVCNQLAEMPRPQPARRLAEVPAGVSR